MPNDKIQSVLSKALQRIGKSKELNNFALTLPNSSDAIPLDTKLGTLASAGKLELFLVENTMFAIVHYVTPIEQREFTKQIKVNPKDDIGGLLKKISEIPCPKTFST